MQVKNLSDLVKYQEKAVVSSEIIKKDAGTVTVFAFDRGQGLSKHTAPFDALVNIIDGRARSFIICHSHESGNPSFPFHPELFLLKRRIFKSFVVFILRCRKIKKLFLFTAGGYSIR